MQAIGLAGLIVILIAWSVSLKGDAPPRKLSLLYGIGSSMLTVYSWLLGDTIFFVLNLGAALLAIVNFLRAKRW